MYPMKTPNRRAERREDIVKYVEQLHGRAPAPANADDGKNHQNEGKTRKELVVVDLTEAGTTSTYPNALNAATLTPLKIHPAPVVRPMYDRIYTSCIPQSSLKLSE